MLVATELFQRSWETIEDACKRVRETARRQATDLRGFRKTSPLRHDSGNDYTLLPKFDSVWIEVGNKHVIYIRQNTRSVSAEIYTVDIDGYFKSVAECAIELDDKEKEPGQPPPTRL
jgi:hypothetical protein